MATQPARPAGKPAPKPAAKSDNEQNIKKWAIIGFGTILVFGGGFFALNKLMTEERGGSKLVDRPFQESKPVKKQKEEEAVAPYPRPIRLFRDFLDAIRKNDVKEVKKLSELDESKYDLLMTEEHVKIVLDSEQSKRTLVTDPKDIDSTPPPKFDPEKTRFVAMLRNGRGYDVMELVLFMRQRGGAEDWVVTRVETRWLSSSGHTPESRSVALGGDRSQAAAPLKDPSTFNRLPEAEPKKLDWLAGTGEAQKAEIERHIRDLFDDKNPAKSSAASQALTNMGKNAIPRLLSEFVDLSVTKDDGVIRGNLLDRTLAAMTDQEMGYDPAKNQSTGAIPPAEGRMRAIRRWFGWWGLNKDLPLPNRNTGDGK